MDTLQIGDVFKMVSTQYGIQVKFVLVCDTLFEEGERPQYDCYVLPIGTYTQAAPERKWLSAADIEQQFRPVTRSELLWHWQECRARANMAVAEGEVALAKAKNIQGAFDALAEEIWDVI